MKKLQTLMLICAASLLSGAALAAQGMDSMGMPASKKPEAGAQSAHKATATVKKLNEKTGIVTLAHGPVPTLNWPAMTMGFKVKDKALLPKLAEGKKVDVEFRREGEDYVVTSVR